MENGPFIVDLPISLMGIPQKILQFCGSNSFHDPIASTVSFRKRFIRGGYQQQNWEYQGIWMKNSKIWIWNDLKIGYPWLPGTPKLAAESSPDHFLESTDCRIHKNQLTAASIRTGFELRKGPLMSPVMQGWPQFWGWLNPDSAWHFHDKLVKKKKPMVHQR